MSLMDSNTMNADTNRDNLDVILKSSNTEIDNVDIPSMEMSLMNAEQMTRAMATYHNMHDISDIGAAESAITMPILPRAIDDEQDDNMPTLTKAPFDKKQSDDLQDDMDHDVTNRPTQHFQAGDEVQEGEEAEEGDESQESDDGFRFKSEADAQGVLTTTIKLILDEYQLDATKRMIFKACKENSIELIKAKTRESAPNVKQMQVSEIKKRMGKFGVATLDIRVVLKDKTTKENIMDNIVEMNRLIDATEGSVHLAHVRKFGYLFETQVNMDAAANFPDYKGFLNDLSERLQMKNGSTAFSKYKRRCKRISELVKIVHKMNHPTQLVDEVDNIDNACKASAFLLGMYITIHSLENDAPDAWKVLIAELKAHKAYLEFAQTLDLADDGRTPVIRQA